MTCNLPHLFNDDSECSNNVSPHSEGFVRLVQIIGNPKAKPPIPAVIPVSKSTWWAGVKSGRYPQPIRTLGKRITVWKKSDILDFINSIDNKEQ